MTNFKIKLADTVIFAECIYESTKNFCQAFLTECEKADISLRITEEDIDFEQKKSIKEQELEGIEPIVFSNAYLETLALYRKIADSIIEFDTLLFHGSALALDGIGYIFTAKSGTGKSTHTRLWREAFGDRVVMINDDKPLIKITDSGCKVYGTPWCGKHNLGSNLSAPLSAIVSLERSDVNKIEQADKRILFPKILSQTYRTKNPQRLAKTLALVDKMLNSISVYSLGCNMNSEAAKVACEGIRGEKHEA